MIKHILITAAFLNAQLAAPLFAQEKAPVAKTNENSGVIEGEFEKGIQRMQYKVDYENKKREVHDKKIELDDKKAQLKNGINDDIVLLNARLSELDYLSDFLDVDVSARNAVAESLKTVRPDSRAIDVAAISGIVLLPSLVVYGVSKYGLPERTTPSVIITPENVTRETPTPGYSDPTVTRTVPADDNSFIARTKATSARLYDSIQRNVKNESVQKASGGIALGSAIVGGIALVTNYFLTKPHRESADNQSRVFLSRLATDNQTDYLSYHAIDGILAEKVKDREFGDAMVTELNTILSDTKKKTNDVHDKEAQILSLDQQKVVLDQQIDQFEARLKSVKAN